jgi:hypothetical protein
MNEFFRNDTGFPITFLLTDEKNNAYDLTDSVILFKMKNTVTGDTLLGGGGVCTIVNATSGICKYDVQDGDFSTAGIYKAELQITFTSGKVRTSKLDNIKISEDI